jgi:mycothiol synthase
MCAFVPNAHVLDRPADGIRVMTLDQLRATLSDFLVRPAVATDAAAVAGLMAATDIELYGVAERELHEVVDDWARPGLDLGRDTVVVLDGGTLAAYAEVYRGERADAWVSPDHRGRGIGSALVDWWIARAAEVGSTRVGQTVSDSDLGSRALLEGRGARAGHTAWILDYDVTARPPPPVVPGGYALRSMQPGEEQAVFAVIDRAFSEWEGREPGAYDDWAATTVASSRFETWMAPVVVHGDEIVAAAILASFDDEGWVQQLAVARAHRGRGLARALLAHAFGRFQGVRDSVGLSTDSRTGALDLYLRIGMQVRRSYTRWSLDLPREG